MTGEAAQRASGTSPLCSVEEIPRGDQKHEVKRGGGVPRNTGAVPRPCTKNALGETTRPG